MLIRIGALLFALPAVLLLVLYGMDMGSVPEAGDPAEVTYYARHPVLVNLGLLLSTAGGLLMSWGMLIKGPSNRDH